MKQSRKQRLTGNRQMSLSMSMNHRSLMLQKVITLLMEVLELSLWGILRGKSLNGRIPSQIECCTGRIHRSRKRKWRKHLPQEFRKQRFLLTSILRLLWRRWVHIGRSIKWYRIGTGNVVYCAYVKRMCFTNRNWPNKLIVPYGLIINTKIKTQCTLKMY